MLLVAHGQWGHLDPHWNVNGDSIAIASLSVSYCMNDLCRTGLEHRDEQTRSGRGKTTSLEWERFVFVHEFTSLAGKLILNHIYWQPVTY